MVENKENKVFSENQSAVIFSDSLRAINSIENDKTLRTLHPDMTDITIAWIPGHCNITGNEKADQNAKNALGYQRSETKLIPGERELRERIDRIITYELQERRKSGSTGEFFRKINPEVGYKITYTNSNRQKEITMTRLRLGKNTLNYYLHKINIHTDGMCNHCKVPEDTAHYLMNCPASGLSEVIKTECEKQNIDFRIEEVLNREETLETIYKNMKRKI